MKKRSMLLWVMFVFLGMCNLFAQEGKTYMPGEAVIRVKEPFTTIRQDKGVISTEKQWMNNIIDAFDVHSMNRVYKNSILERHKGRYILKFPENIPVKTVVDRINSESNVMWAEPNFIFSLTFTPDDKYFRSPEWWGLQMIEAPKAWDFTAGSSDIVVAVIDNGLDIDHDDIKNQLWENPDEKNGQAGVDDDNNNIVDDIHGCDVFPYSGSFSDGYHGTPVTGILGAQKNNDSPDDSTGIAGIAGGGKNGQGGVRVMAIEATHGIYDKFINSTNLANALNYAYDPHGDSSTDDGADIINMSLGNPQNDWSDFNLVHEAVDDAYQYGRNGKGTVMVAAAGNYPTDPDFYPADFSNVLSVGCLDSQGYHCEYRPGSINAPGDVSGIYSTYPDNDYGYIGKTSAASPHVAGVAALILSLNEDLTASEVMNILLETKESTNRCVNAYEALKYTLRHYGGTLRGNVVLHKALILEPGVTLTIEPGTTIQVNGYYNIIAKAGATIQAIGTEEKPITFTSLNGTQPSSWKNIFLYGSGSRFEHCEFKYGHWAVNVSGYPCTGGQNIIKHCTFHNNDQALRIQNNNSTIVENCKIYDNRHGIVTYSVSNLDFTANRIYENSRDGLYSIGNSDLSFVYNVIDNNGEGHTSTCNGIYAGYSDYITLNPGSGKNTIRNNYSKEVYASYGSPVIVLGNGSGGNNAVFDSLRTWDDEVYNNSGNSTIWAQYCWWGQNGAQTAGSVNTAYPLSSRPSWTGTTSGSLCKQAAPLPSDLHKRIAELKALITAKSQTSEALYALAELYGILRHDMVKNSLGERDAALPYFESLYTTFGNSALGRMALEKMIMWQTSAGETAAAIELSEKAISIFPKQEGAVIYSNLVMLHLLLDNTEQAHKALRTLQTESKDNSNIEFLKESICSVQEQIDLGVRGQAQGSEPKEQAEAEKDKDNACIMRAFPNPGNPSMSVHFSIPQEQHVELSVYNLLGRTVKTLYSGRKQAGTHTVMWDGTGQNNSAAPTGVYIIRLHTGGKVHTAKVSLVK